MNKKHDHEIYAAKSVKKKNDRFMLSLLMQEFCYMSKFETATSMRISSKVFKNNKTFS